MSGDILLKVPLTIEIVSPVHIGTGERLNRLEFVEQNGKVYIIDEQKFLQRITQTPQLQAEFENLCLRGGWLTDLLRKNNIPITEVAQYDVRKGGRLSSNILPFIKMPGTPPSPYLPGSSIKGALRSAFLRGDLLRGKIPKNKARAKVRDQLLSKKPKKADDALEREYFGKDQHHEWVRVLQVTDTKPVSPQQLHVADVRVLSSTQSRTLKEKDTRYGKTMILNPEVLWSKTKLQSYLIVNNYLTQEPATRTLNSKQWAARVEEFATYCNKVAEDQIDQEIDFFSQHNQNDVVEWYEKLDGNRKTLELKQGRFACLLRLGWGAGFDDKTVSDIFDDETFDDIRYGYGLPVGRPGRRGKGLSKSFSPKSRKLAIVRNKNKENHLPLGWVILHARW